MGIRIATFNVKNLSDGQGRDLDRIAALINDNDIDIVAMQEVLGKGKVLNGMKINKAGYATKAYERSLQYRLKGKWEVFWGNPGTSAKNYPYLGDDSRGEGYAFLWKADKFEIPVGKNGEKAYPTIWKNYRPIQDSDTSQFRLIRDPFYGRFKVKGCKAEIRLICTHIVYGKPKSDNFLFELDEGAIQMRKNELYILAGQIYPRISEYYKDINCNVPYTIILGDYNLNLPSSGVGKAIIPEVLCFDSRGRVINSEEDSFCKIYTVQSELTTLKRDKPEYASNYDHFSFDERVRSDIVKNVYRIDAVNQNNKSTDEDEKFNEFKREVSDHVPVVIEIDFT